VTIERTNPSRMVIRILIVAIGAVTAWLVSIWTAAEPARAATTCVWGGTPAAPTGKFWINPGLRWIPAPAPLPFRATGPAEGQACKRTVTFEGTMPAGSNCALVGFEGVVKGVPGVARFWGRGAAPITHEFLYDRNGELVGFNNPSVLNAYLVEGIVNDPDSCASPEGFTHGYFSSVITLFD
jgi:hypothetical protein